MTVRIYTHYLVDELGNNIVDESGNFIMVLDAEETTGLHAQTTETLLHAPQIGGERVAGVIPYFLVDEVGDYIVDEVGDNILILEEGNLIVLNAQATNTLVHT